MVVLGLWGVVGVTTLYTSGFLTLTMKLVSGQCQVGGLTGAVASKRVTEARCHLKMVGNHLVSVKAQGGLTARQTSREQVMKVGLSGSGGKGG